MFLFLLFLLLLCHGQIVFQAGDNTLPLYANTSVSVVVDSDDWPGVIRAAGDLVTDFGNVTGNANALQLTTDTTSVCGNITTIVVGTVGRSDVLQRFIDDGLDVSEIEGKWESYVVAAVDSCNTLVIAGSDKRGTIYGIYAISEQIGVSPWHFWADVPAHNHSEIHFNKLAPIVQGEPSVRYRGFFLNDEEPSLSGWANVTYRQGNYTHFVHEFYEPVFELILRLKANLLWPAMWRAMFGLDDDNQYWADYYGVVMSTSHTEPMQRATNEWLFQGSGDWDYATNADNITEYWRAGVARGKPYEGVWVEGMRGFGDTAMSSDTETTLLEEVIATQQGLLAEAFGNTSVPQVWCLYKEVQSYYEQGMEVPDDIILLWVDDNWGNIRRLPRGNETDRVGGAGVYYHFDYVGDPRNYKWINTVSLERTWEQMTLAYRRQATQFWIVNVGDLKGLEIPISYFMDLAYDFDRWSAPNQIMDWTEQWAQALFGSSGLVTSEIADIIDVYGFLASRRKFEFVNGTIYSIINYDEARTVLADWAELSARAWKVYDQLSLSVQPAFFETVLHPVHAGYIVHDLYLSAGKNQLYAEQGRNQASYLALHVRQRFQDDADWKYRWNSVLDGRWVHMMDQTHLGYTYWQNPMRDTMPQVTEFLFGSEAMSGAAGISADGSMGAVPGDDQYNGATYDNSTLILPQLDPYSGNTWIEVFNRGYEDFDFEILPWNDYVKVSPDHGTVSATNTSVWNLVFVNVSIDWKSAPEGAFTEYINVTSNTSTYWYKIPTVLYLPANKTSLKNESFKGFVESQGHVSMEADSFTSVLTGNGTNYTVLERFGRTRSGVILQPFTAEPQQASTDASYLTYDFYAFTGSNVTNVTVVLSPSLNVGPDNPLRYAVAVDDGKPSVHQIYEDATDPTAYPDGWELAVEQNAWIRTTTHDVDAGPHSLKVWLLDANIVLQKIIVDFGGVKESYLGPPESYYYE